MKIRFRWYRGPDATRTAHQLRSSVEADAKVSLEASDELVRETGMGRETWEELCFTAPNLAAATRKIRRVSVVLSDYELSTPPEIWVGSMSLLSYAARLERRITKRNKKR